MISLDGSRNQRPEKTIMLATSRSRNTNSRGAQLDRATVGAVWRKGKPVKGYNPELYRKDRCNAWIERSEYGNTNSQHGWEIDHVKPVSLGGTDSLSNLQPLQWANNRHKGDDFPQWSCAVGAPA